MRGTLAEIARAPDTKSRPGICSRPDTRFCPKADVIKVPLDSATANESDVVTKAT